MTYPRTRKPEHPNAHRDGRIRIHRLVMAAKLGRPLNPDEHVHHVDGNHANNNPANLMVVSNAEHMRLHRVASGDFKRNLKQYQTASA